MTIIVNEVKNKNMMLNLFSKGKIKRFLTKDVDLSLCSFKVNGSFVEALVLDAKKMDSRVLNSIFNSSTKVESFALSQIMEREFGKLYIPNREDKIYNTLKPYSKYEYFLKRVIDYIVVFLLALVSLPIVVYSIYRIKKESPGSIIYKQSRVGKDGKVFTCYKFRTMHENSYHNPYTLEGDSRIFPWARIMRKTRIDELPQLFNVLKGDMHLVGPRAEWDILSKEYEVSVPNYKKRYLVRPGITGWAQVNYPYGIDACDAKEKLSYDLYYIKNWSVWIELKTIFKTVSVVLGKKGQ